MAGIDYPDLADVKAYLGQTALTYTDASITSALAAEKAAQARVCRLPVVDATHPLPVNLREALMRRVARNIAMRRLPLGIQAEEVGSTRLGSTDPEIRRLEGPYRKVVLG